VIEPSEEQPEPESLDTEGDWRKPHFSDMSHSVKEEWTAQFFSACGVWYSMVGSARDEGARKCPRCVKALEDKGNG